MLERRGRRELPLALYPPAEPEAPPKPPLMEPIWLEPLPDEWLGASGEDVEADYARRESVRLAFVAALQALPPRQRAVLLLCDVLDWRAAEAADCLDMTASAVSSALHRARATLARLDPPGERAAASRWPPDRQTQALLERYVSAWETADVAGLVALLQEEAVLTMPPSPSWYSGREAIGRAFGGTILAPSLAGLFRLRPVGANGQHGFAMYERDAATGVYRARGLHVLALAGPSVAAVHIFLTPSLFALFGLPDTLPA
jgi:RNA polymerase sigma-70 factor (ECF subfamily)